MKSLIVFIFLLVGNLALSQDYSELRHTQDDEYRCDFYVSTDHKKIKYKDTVVYTWYKSKKIMSTQGSSAGDILNGSFKKYYKSGQLAESGTFTMGLKTGRWQTWDVNGLLTSIANYKKGQFHGKIYEYTNGQLTATAKYKKGTKKLKKEPRQKEENNVEEGESEKKPLLKRIFTKKEKDPTEEEKDKKKWFSKKDKKSRENKKTKKPKKDKKPEEVN